LLLSKEKLPIIRIPIMRALAYLLFALYTYTSFAQDDEPLKYFFLRGKVKTIRMYPYKVKENEDKTIEKTLSNGVLYDKNAFIKLNKAGKVTKRIFYDDKNKVIGKRKIYYDHKNRRKKEKVYDSKGKLTREFIMTYDEKRKESREVFHLEKDRDFQRITLCRLDDNGNPVVCITYYSNGEIIEKCYIRYDDFGNLAERIFITPDDEKKYVYQNEYNLIGFPTKLVKEDYVNFTENFRVNYFYKDNHPPYAQSISANGVLPAYSELSYQYDKKGNWIRKEVRYKDKLVFIVELKLTYY
jgi:hypothetical protein